MAIEKVINIVANAKQATSEIKSLFDNLVKAELQQDALNESAEDMEKAYKDSTKQVTKDMDSVGQSAKKQSGVVSGLKSSVQAVGTALKALGIGMIIALVAKFTMVLSENKKVMDFVSTVSNTLSIVMNQLITAFINISEKIYEATGGFDALTSVVGSALKIAFNNLKIVVLQLQGGFAGLKLAYEKVFGDDAGVEKAKKDLIEIGTKLKETLKDNVAQGKNIINNIGEAVGEVVSGVSTLVSEGGKAILDIDLKAAYAQGQAITRSKNNFELLALQQQRMQLMYQFQAEALRQVRDDDTKAISERIKANQELEGVLKKQFESESGTIRARINSLQQEQNLLGFTVERQNEIYQLNTDLIDVAERLKGVESEQLSNKNALLREQIDLQNTVFENENSRQLAQLEFEASIAKTTEERLAKERERLELENKQIEEDLETKRELYALGTQARVDAEQEFLNKKQEIDNALIALDIEAEKNEKEKAKKQIELDEMVKDAKVSIADNTLNLINEIAGKGSKIGKALAVSQATISGIQGTQNAFTTASASPITAVFPAYPFIQAGLAGAFSLLQIKKIMSTDASGKSSPSPTNTDSGGRGSSAPSFNLVAGTGSNQIAQSLAGQNQPLQAFVVGSAVTSQQELDRNAVNTASL